MMTGLDFRQDYFSDPAAYAGLATLLRETFDIDIRLQDRFGGPNLSAMPFGYFDSEMTCVANFSAFSMPVVIDGKRVKAVGYQSGAVRPEYRGQGLYRDLMQRAFAWAAAQDFDIGILLTDKPALYQPCGFRSVTQHAFRGKVSPTERSYRPARTLSLDDAADVQLIEQLLAARQPVSDIFAVASGTYFLLNACFDTSISLAYLKDLDAVIAWKADKDRIDLLDIVAAKIPPLADIVAALGVAATEVRVHFPPDRLDWARAQPEPYDVGCDLMLMPMRDTVKPTRLAMLSPMADF
jgi:GNAT superfamily N-acetyltransferase